MRSPAMVQLNLVSRPEVYEETLIRSGGTPIALSVWRAYTQGATGPTIVFLPGTMLHPLFYEELLDALAGAGLNVVGVHFAEHGKSPRTGALRNFEQLVQNGKDAVSYALSRFGPTVIVLGSSQGGIVAAAMAGTDDRISAVFAHNIVDVELNETLQVTRFGWLTPLKGLVVGATRIAARLFPKLQLPASFYLEPERVFRSDLLREQYFSDPLSLKTYPLFLVASLLEAKISRHLKCPRW